MLTKQMHLSVWELTHKLRFDTNALKSLEKLPTSISQRIIKKLQQTKTNPHRYFKKLTDTAQYSLRVGEYRVIADITTEHIVVLYIDHRKRVYDRL